MEISGSQFFDGREKWKFCTHNIPKFVHQPSVIMAFQRNPTKGS